MVNVQQANPEDLGRVRDLVLACGLPFADPSPDADMVFLVAREAGELVGCVGLEVYGDGALLRSFAVREQSRRTGVGDQLVLAAEEMARSRGIASMYLLTETAATYFVVRGWRLIDREEVPETVRASPEFNGVCPASAICLWLPIFAQPAQSSQPEASQPEASQPEASQPEPSQPEPSQPEPSQPEPSQPVASQPVASQQEADVQPSPTATTASVTPQKPASPAAPSA